MQKASRALRSAIATVVLRLDRHLRVRLKRAVAALLAAWLAYFALISLAGHTLNKATVPLIEVPLAMALVVQGTAVLFIAALILLRAFARARS